MFKEKFQEQSKDEDFDGIINLSTKEYCDSVEFFEWCLLKRDLRNIGDELSKDERKAEQSSERSGFLKLLRYCASTVEGLEYKAKKNKYKHLNRDDLIEIFSQVLIENIWSNITVIRCNQFNKNKFSVDDTINVSGKTSI